MRSVHKLVGFTWALVGALALGMIATCTLAQSNEQNITAPLPPEPANWINSVPLSLDSLNGKGAVIWFFEEQCPRCRAAWPDLMALAKKHENEPVAFIAVNSGTPRVFGSLFQAAQNRLADRRRCFSSTRTSGWRKRDQSAKHLPSARPHARWQAADGPVG